MKVQLTIRDVQKALRQLGYFDGPIDGDAVGPNFRDDLKRFQADYRLTVDGWYGPESEKALLPLVQKLASASLSKAEFRHLCRWRLTYYYIADQSRFKKDVDLVPVRNPKGTVLAEVEAAFFSQMALEGTGRLRDGRLLNVAHDPSYLPCDPRTFAPCFAIAKRNGWIPDKAGYAGIQCDKAGTKAVAARCFELKPVSPNGWPRERLGIPLDPWRTIATDIGAKTIARHDPKYKGKGGVVPPGTKVFILESVGWKLPDGSTHDGWWTANDTGGGIFGAHFDLFVGTPALAALNRVPDRGHVWFLRCEAKLGMNYTYGL